MGAAVGDKKAVLAQLDLLAGFPDRQLDALAAAARDRHVAAGSTLCRQGDSEIDGYVVVDGEADVIVDGTVVGTAGPGEVLGELALLGDGHRTATVRATTDLHVLVLDADDLHEIMSAVPAAAAKLNTLHRRS